MNEMNVSILFLYLKGGGEIQKFVFYLCDHVGEKEIGSAAQRPPRQSNSTLIQSFFFLNIFNE